MKEDDLISIIMPVYNAEKFLRDSIKSVQNQSYQAWELLLIDDASVDGCESIIYNCMRSDKRIKYVKLEKIMVQPMLETWEFKWLRENILHF